MVKEKPIYQDNQLKIEFHASEEYFLYLKDKKGQENGYLLPRGILQELAKTKRGGIESKIHAFNEGLLYAIKQEGISVDSLHVALCQAYLEEEEKYAESIRKSKNKY